MKLIALIFAFAAMMMPASAQESYTYGDLRHGVEVTATEDNLPEVIMTWMNSNPNRIPIIAIQVQAAGDGIMCDLLMTYYLLNTDENDGRRFADLAQEAQQLCMLAATQAAR